MPFFYNCTFNDGAAIITLLVYSCYKYIEGFTRIYVRLLQLFRQVKQPFQKIALNRKSYASIIAKELGLMIHIQILSYSKINDLSAVDIINENIRDLQTKFGIDDIPTKNHQFPNMNPNINFPYNQQLKVFIR